MIVIEENAFSILERRLNRIETLLLDMKDLKSETSRTKKIPTKNKTSKHLRKGTKSIQLMEGSNG
jgi:hypothetical protein